MNNKACKDRKVISISLSPNTEKDDIKLAKSLLFDFKSWIRGRNVKELENKFKVYLGVKHSFSFNSGRSSLMAILEALGIKEGDEVLIQGFTCSSAVVPILEKRAKPVFVDIDDTLNLDPEDLKKKITSRSKAVIIQHTFGFPAKIDEIINTAKESKLFLIEDCAHSLGAKFKDEFCGTFGDIAFYSLGRDKIISSVFGGLVVTNNDNLAEKVRNFQERIRFPSGFWVFQQLLHPILVSNLVLKTYNRPRIGRLILVFLQKTKFLSKAVHKKEKGGKLPKYFPKKLPNALAALALNQFKKLDRFNSHRAELSLFYESSLKDRFSLPLLGKNGERKASYMRYPVLVENSDEVLKKARKLKILLNDGWRKSAIVPPDTDVCKVGYKLGSCPKAEKVAKNILNLPTHINISKKEAEEIVSFLIDYDSKRNK